MRKSRRVLLAVIVTVVVLALAGCASPNRFAIFDTAPTAEDQLPADFDELDQAQLADEYDLDSVRLAATYEESVLYLLEASDGSPCLAVARGISSFIACGGLAGTFTAEVGGIQFEVFPAPIAERDGWTIVSDNIRVKDSR